MELGGKIQIPPTDQMPSSCLAGDVALKDFTRDSEKKVFMQDLPFDAPAYRIRTGSITWQVFF